jgi:hypothetical protein
MNNDNENQHTGPIRIRWAHGHTLNFECAVSLCMQYVTQLRNRFEAHTKRSLGPSYNLPKAAIDGCGRKEGSRLHGMVHA